MKRVLIAAVAIFAFAGVASAQPAYDASQGAAPSEYPKCTAKGQDRCVSGRGMSMKGKKMHHKMHKESKSGSSKDGERG